MPHSSVGTKAVNTAIDDLLKHEIEPLLMNDMDALNKTCYNCFGYSLLMIDASKWQLDAQVNSRNFLKRINSAENIVVTETVVKTDADFVKLKMYDGLCSEI